MMNDVQIHVPWNWNYHVMWMQGRHWNTYCLPTYQRKWNIQSNMYTTATLGTPKKRPLFKVSGIAGRCSQFNNIKFWKIWAQAGHCRHVAVVQGWLLTQVWLYYVIVFLSCCLSVSLSLCLSVFLSFCTLICTHLKIKSWLRNTANMFFFLG